MSKLHSHQRAFLKEGDRLLTAATSLKAVLAIRKRAKSIRSSAKKAGLRLAIINQAAELQVMAAWKAGRILTSMKLRGGDRKSKGCNSPLKNFSINRDDSKRLRRFGRLPEADLRQHLKSVKERGEEINPAEVLRLERTTSGGSAKVSIQPSSRRRTVQRNSGDNSHLQMAHDIEEAKNHLAGIATMLKLNEGQKVVQLDEAQVRACKRRIREMREVVLRLHTVAHQHLDRGGPHVKFDDFEGTDGPQLLES